MGLLQDPQDQKVPVVVFVVDLGHHRDPGLGHLPEVGRDRLLGVHMFHVPDRFQDLGRELLKAGVDQDQNLGHSQDLEVDP